MSTRPKPIAKTKLVNGERVPIGTSVTDVQDITSTSSSPSGIDYTFNVGTETADQYNTRIEKARGSSPTMEESGFIAPSLDTGSAADTFARQYQKDATQTIDQDKIRQNYISQFQDQINALNQIYDQQLSKAQKEGVGRVGSGTAILARRGLGGSPRGEAIKEGVLDQNRGIENAIQQERAVAIQAIYGKATELAQKEAAERRAAKEAGATKYLDYLKGQDARKASNLSSVVQALLAQGIDPETMSADELNAVGKQIGVDGKSLLGSYKVAKYTFDQEEAAAEFEKEGELLNRAKTQNEIDLANKKFDEDRRQFGMDYALKVRALNEKGDGATPTGTTQDTRSQLDFLISSASKAKELANQSGQGSLTKGFGDLVGGSKYRQLESYANSLKTNMLTLATDPSIKKFFGPQMSNADVQLMTSAGTTLNPELQSPEQLQAEIERLEDFFVRAKAALPTEATQDVITAPDGQEVIIVDQQ